jgi:acyl carrier protein
MNKLEDQLKQVFSNIFNIKYEKINDRSSIDNIKKWDSLNHIKLVIALENKFKVKIKTDDIIKLNSFKKIKKILNELM